MKSGVGGAFLNSGQTCLAMTRMLVPKSRLAEAETLAVEAASAMKVGDPFEQTTALGPLASAAQRDRVNNYIQKVSTKARSFSSVALVCLKVVQLAITSSQPYFRM